MDKGTEIFIREFFLQTKSLNDKELSDYLDNELYKLINYYDEKKGHLDVVFEIITNERKVDLKKLTEDFDYIEPEQRNDIEHRIVIVFSNSTYTEVDQKIVRIKFKHKYTSSQIVEAYLKKQKIDYTYQNSGVIEYLKDGIHNINHVYYVYKEDLETSIFDLKPRNKEDASIWLEHLNKLYVMSLSQEFSNKISEKKSYLKKIIKL